MTRSDRITIVTGGASGMGEATVRMLVAQGERAVIADLQDERGSALAEELGEAVAYLRTDMTVDAQVAELFDFTVSTFGTPTGLVNNAGIIGVVGPIDSIDVEAWDFTIAVLLRSVFLGTKHAARVMKPLHRGAIVNTTSIAAFRGDIGPHAYAAAKAGVMALTRNTAAELGSYGIRVNAVAPGRTVTPMTADTWGGADANVDVVKAAFLEQTPLADRIGTAEDIAAAYLWLLSDAAGYISGQYIAVDGGLLGGSLPVSVAAEKLARYRGESTVIREAGQRGVSPR